MENMKQDAEFIASQCKFLRRVLGLTQENLADAAGLTVRTIQKVESGRHVPELQTLKSIARGVGVDVEMFNKPTPAQQKYQEKELERAMRQTVLVSTFPIRTANDFYSRNREWHALMVDTATVDDEEALGLAAAISDWMDDLDGIWGISTASQRLEYATAVADLCRAMERASYFTCMGQFRQQHMQQNGMIWEVGLITFRPMADHDGERHSLVRLSNPWEIPEQDRPKW